MLRRFDHVWKVFTFCLIPAPCHVIRKYSRWSTIPKYVIISIDRPGSSVFLIFARLRFAYFFGGCGCLAWSWIGLKVKGDTRQLLRNQKKIGYHFRVVFMFMLLCHWLQNFSVKRLYEVPNLGKISTRRGWPQHLERATERMRLVLRVLWLCGWRFYDGKFEGAIGGFSFEWWCLWSPPQQHNWHRHQHHHQQQHQRQLFVPKIVSIFVFCKLANFILLIRYIFGCCWCFFSSHMLLVFRQKNAI